MKGRLLTIILAVTLFLLAILSLFVGVIDINLSSLSSGDAKQWEIFIVSRLPRLLAILCTGVGMSVAGLIMQQLCMNKFVSPTTGSNHFICPIWHFAGIIVYAGVYFMGTSFICICHSNSWYMAVCMVYSKSKI